ncbi:hypothetical protein GCM10026982_25040 [Nocardiopsis aegyptia]
MPTHWTVERGEPKTRASPSMATATIVLSSMVATAPTSSTAASRTRGASTRAGEVPARVAGRSFVMESKLHRAV